MIKTVIYSQILSPPSPIVARLLEQQIYQYPKKVKNFLSLSGKSEFRLKFSEEIAILLT